jgi:hypothetical protein
MIKYSLIIFLFYPQTSEQKQLTYPVSSPEECYAQIAKIAVAVSGKSVYFQTACVEDDETVDPAPAAPTESPDLTKI